MYWQTFNYNPLAKKLLVGGRGDEMTRSYLPGSHKAGK